MKINHLCVMMIAALALFIASCEEAPGKFTVSGTVTCTTTRIAIGYPSNGKTVFLKLVGAGGAYDAEALYSTQATFTTTGSTTYTIPDVEEGEYTGWAFIDMDSSGGILPNTGDYAVSAGMAVTVTEDTIVNILDADWERML